MAKTNFAADGRRLIRKIYQRLSAAVVSGKKFQELPAY
jgi:hypothetical protein